ncbi:MAG TPA: hypothetical protein VGK94_05385 [Candidatus Polarisedimenticolia bacterium]|jgi:hypothetical protein
MMTEGRTKRLLVTSFSLCLSLGACQHAMTVDLADFKSDGCSMFPDGSYFSCCYVHDVAYWPGGTAEARELADKSLRTCVLGITGNETLAEAMYKGVRLGGGPELPTHYRWGYGWRFPYRKEYSPLTPEEQNQVTEKTQMLCTTIRVNPSTTGFMVSMADVNREISVGQARQICPGL